MKEIKIFIGSSVDKTEFEIEREKLGSFINGLNRKYVKQGIFIDLYDCETVSSKMRAEGSQKQHDDYIENEADAAFFMFFKKAGEFTLHELQLARDTLVSKKRPDIFTYFKVVGNDIEQTEEIKKAVDLIANSYGHYFSKFTDVDTIKLGMLQYLTDKLNDGSSITINDGIIYLNETKIDGISIDNIFAYQNNSEYKNLQREIDSLTRAINDAVSNKQFHNIELLTTQREEKERILASLEADILNMLIQMQRELKKENADPLRMQAYQLIEMGKIKEAQNLFPIEALKLKSHNLLKKEELKRQENKELVENARVRIEALKLDVFNKNRFDLIKQTYASVLENAFICRDDAFVYSYVSFLDDQNDSPEAYKVAKRLEGFYQYHSDEFSDADAADLYNLMGVISGNLSLIKEQEEYYTKAIEIYERLAEETPERYNGDLATSYNNAGNFYRQQGKTEQAEYCHTKAIEIREKLAKENPERYNGNLAMSYNNAGVFYDEQGKTEQAEYYYTKAIEIRERLAKENPERYSGNLATSYNNAGNFYCQQGKPKQAEYYYTKAIEIREKLAEENPERYSADLATSYYNYGLFTHEKMYLDKALKLAKKQPDNPYFRRIIDALEN
ncbi:MAG: tetratricopeptide repeat protein [Eubacterium sp.]